MKDIIHKHISEDDLQRLLCGSLSAEQELELLALIGECEHCAELLYEANEKLSYISAPTESSSSILVAAGIKHNRKKESLFGYALRVAASVCAALVLLFSGFFANITEVDISAKLKPGSDFLREITETLITAPARGFDETPNRDFVTEENDLVRRYSDYE